MRPGRERPGVDEICENPNQQRTLLQCGPGANARERRMDGASDRGGDLASMRPGRERPGVREDRRRSATRDGASMRPGRERPGTARGRRSSARPARGFNEARARTPRSARAALSRCAPWGGCFNEARARTPGSGTRTARLSPPIPSFNEARARRPRSVLFSAGRRHVATAAFSMRPGREDPGTG